MAESAAGETRDYQKTPASLEVSDLEFTVPEQSARKLQAWFDDFVLKGNCGEDRERNGTLEYLGPDLKDPVFTLSFKNLGILRIAPEKAVSGSESIRRLKVTLYCEQVQLEPGKD